MVLAAGEPVSPERAFELEAELLVKALRWLIKAEYLSVRLLIPSFIEIKAQQHGECLAAVALPALFRREIDAVIEDAASWVRVAGLDASDRRAIEQGDDEREVIALGRFLRCLLGVLTQARLALRWRHGRPEPLRLRILRPPQQYRRIVRCRAP
jgi:hypothetical protein